MTIFLNNGKQAAVTPHSVNAKDVETLARQISQCDLVAAVNTFDYTYINGKKLARAL